MDMARELEIFKRCRAYYPNNSKADSDMGSLLFCRQIYPYMHSSVGMGLVIHHLLNINSEGLYTQCRESKPSYVATEILEQIAEYNHAVTIKKIYSNICKLDMSTDIVESDLEQYKFTEEDADYFGEDFVNFNNSLVVAVFESKVKSQSA